MFSQDTSRRDFLLIVCASVSWGTVGIANQTLYTSGVTNALSLSFLRLAIATPLFFLACWMRLGRSLFHIKRLDLGVIMLMGSMIAFSQACSHRSWLYPLSGWHSFGIRDGGKYCHHV
jgi:drug/metabolite transporter (DMT)-like permease